MSATNKTMLDVALEHARRGLEVFPLAAGTKDRPLIKEWNKRATADEARIREFWTQWPDANCGVHAKGLLVIDVDTKRGKDGFASLAEFEAQLSEPLEATLETETPSGGRHLFYRLPPGVSITNGVDVLGPGLDIRTTDGYLVGAGSRTAAGEYRIFVDEAIAAADPKLIERCGVSRVKAEQATDAPAITTNAEDAEARAIEYLKQLPVAEKGKRNNLLMLAARNMGDFGLPVDRAVAVAFDHFRRDETLGDELSEEEIERTVRSSYRKRQTPVGSRSAEGLGLEATDTAKPQTEKPGDDVPTANTAARFRKATRLADMTPAPALWENAIAEGSIFAIGAVPGRAKSYAATGLAYALAASTGGFLGRTLSKDRAAIYVDVERLASTLQRISAWADTDGIDPTVLPLHLTGDFILSDPTAVQNLVDAIRDLEQGTGRKVGLVVIDSLGAAMYGAELNASGPATMAGHMLRKIRDALGCTVGVVAHSPKSGDETVAGSLHFDAIFDSTLFMRSQDDGATGVLYVKKSNAIALEEPEKSIPWRRETVLRAAGDRPVKVHRLVAGEALQSAQKPPVGRARAPTLADKAVSVLVDMTLGGGLMKLDAWKAEVARHSGADTGKARRADATRAVKKVLAAGRARIEDDGSVRALS